MNAPLSAPLSAPLCAPVSAPVSAPLSSPLSAGAGVRRCGVLLALCWLGACDPTPSPTLPSWQPVGVLDCRADLSASTVGLGEALELTLRVQCSKADDLGLAARIPAGFAGAATTRIAPSGEGFRHTIVYALRPIDVGVQKIAPFEIEDGGAKATTPELEVTVTSALGTGDDPVQLEAQSVLAPRVVWWPWLLGSLVCVALLVLLWWWLRRPRRGPPLPVEVAVPAHVKALRALARLRQAAPAHDARDAVVDAFYVEVSQVLRVYLEERFGLHAPLRSTEEFLAELEQDAALRPEHRQRLRGFLQQCDLVKFARLHPATDVHEQTLGSAETVVEETRSDHAGSAARDTSTAAIGVAGGPR